MIIPRGKNLKKTSNRASVVETVNVEFKDVELVGFCQRDNSRYFEEVGKNNIARWFNVKLS